MGIFSYLELGSTSIVSELGDGQSKLTANQDSWPWKKTLLRSVLIPALTLDSYQVHKYPAPRNFKKSGEFLPTSFWREPISFGQPDIIYAAAKRRRDTEKPGP